MARELISKIIDGKNYQFSQMGAKESLKLLTRLVKICGESFTLGFAALTGDKKKEQKGAEVEDTEELTPKSILDRNINGELLGKAMRALCDRLDEDLVLSIVEDMTSKNVLCDGKQIIFHSHYEAKLAHMFKVLYAALEVQYGDFFSVLKENQGLSGVTPLTQAQPT